MATVRGARRIPGPTTERAHGTSGEPTSLPAPHPILPHPSRRARTRQLHASGSSSIDGQLLTKADLAQAMRVSVRTVERTMDHLHKKGVILSQQKRRKRGGGYFLEYRLRPFMPEGGRKSERPRMNEQIASTRDARSQSAPSLSVPAAKIPSAVTTAPTLTQQAAASTPTCEACYGTGWAAVSVGGEHKGVRRCACRTRVSSQHPDKMTACMHPDILSPIPPLRGV